MPPTPPSPRPPRALIVGAVLAATAACTTGTPGDDTGTRTPTSTVQATTGPTAADPGTTGDDVTDGASPPATDGTTGGDGADADAGGGHGGTAATGVATATSPVAVTLTISGWAGDRAVVSGYAEVVERGGTCRATLTRPGAADIVVESPAVTDVATTSCSVEVPGSRLAAGAWSVTLQYGSAAHEGISTAATLEVPA
ncbi:hypothetical protein [Cellulomonas dongxiuzhuiae]|uniref:Bacterial spore germination immunoglobulin-like domain-containing protein n=1 Tax=Cellulomonas dongxiuzhuiae TaxID=2819979 RepID=A0ABX8GHK7_9CELL|nr:hypothetical protein [Cellulomonas dongxiuzhuiae]MBO3093939.1 hypothetical protein [Cellulomonas dongxiuzhuiae]QWC15021.1 hypothetical protein KKR89_11825 [Cellulomonas dongxiuzhuiae]